MKLFFAKFSMWKSTSPLSGRHVVVVSKINVTLLPGFDQPEEMIWKKTLQLDEECRWSHWSWLLWMESRPGSLPVEKTVNPKRDHGMIVDESFSSPALGLGVPCFIPSHGWRAPLLPRPASLVAHGHFLFFRFYIESISYLKDNATIELFFLNAKSCIYKVSSILSSCPGSCWNLVLSPKAGSAKLAYQVTVRMRRSHV